MNKEEVVLFEELKRRMGIEREMWEQFSPHSNIHKRSYAVWMAYGSLTAWLIKKDNNEIICIDEYGKDIKNEDPNRDANEVSLIWQLL